MPAKEPSPLQRLSALSQSVWVDFISRDARVRTIRAHTLAETNASTRVLEKCGFKKIGETTDPENNLPVWRWERAPRSTSTS